MSKSLKLNPQELLIKSGIGEDITDMLEQAIAAHAQTGRGASVVLKIVIKADKETGLSKARGRVTSTVPEGDDDQHTRKMPSISPLTVGEHPGQQSLLDAELTPEQVAARINLAVAGSGRTCTAYAKTHGLPYIALRWLLATGAMPDAAAYGAIYDHAMTLDSEACDAPEVEQDGKSRAAG